MSHDVPLMIPWDQSEVWMLRVSIGVCEPNFQVLFNSLEEVSVVTGCSVLNDGQRASSLGLIITDFLNIQFITESITGGRRLQLQHGFSSWHSVDSYHWALLPSIIWPELATWQGEGHCVAQPLQRPLPRPGLRRWQEMTAVRHTVSLKKTPFGLWWFWGCRAYQTGSNDKWKECSDKFRKFPLQGAQKRY